MSVAPASEPLRLNLGSGDYPLKGFINIDLHVEADMQADFTTMDWENVDEVMMSHVLEHLSWRVTGQVLRVVHDWMKPGGKLTVEVPDMKVLFKRGTTYPSWVLGIYGAQIHEGEYHKAGFDQELIEGHIEAAGFTVVSSRTFLSDISARLGYPCIKVVATA